MFSTLKINRQFRCYREYQNGSVHSVKRKFESVGFQTGIFFSLYLTVLFCMNKILGSGSRARSTCEPVNNSYQSVYPGRLRRYRCFGYLAVTSILLAGAAATWIYTMSVHVTFNLCTPPRTSQNMFIRCTADINNSLHIVSPLTSWMP